MNSINPITRRVISVIILASVIVHLVTLWLAHTAMSSWRWQQIPFHSAIEVAGSAIALFVVYMLVLLERNQQGTSYNITIASALAAMGILDGMHAIVPTGQLFVWLHSCATFIGGLMFLCLYLPEKIHRRLNFLWLYAVVFSSVIFAILSGFYSKQLPVMVDDSGFSQTAMFLNVAGGAMLLASAVKLFVTYLKTQKTDDLLFVLHCTMFGAAAIMFQQSALWDVSWWGWHLLRFFAYGVALWFALVNEQIINTQIRRARDVLNQEVEKKAAQLSETSQQLVISQKQQNAVFQCLTDAIFVCDQQGIIKFFSVSAERMFRYRSEEMVGKNISLLLVLPAENSVLSERELFNRELFGTAIEMTAITKSEQRFPIELICSEVDLDNETNIVGVIREISSRKEYERALKKAKEQADKANQAKSAFLANTSHEIRTPMNGVYGNLQLLAKEQLSPAAMEYIDNAIYSTKSLMTVINDILDISKIEAGKLSIEAVDFSLSKLLANIEAEVSSAAAKKSIAFQSIKNVSHDIWVGDPTRIRQILINLTSNAVKFTNAGAVVLTVSYLEKIKQLVFIVTDTGIGMNQAAIERLFVRFEQADNSITRQFGGTGIGMSITHSLVELMAGEIEVSSEEGHGTTFTVQLPLSPSKLEQITEPENDQQLQQDLSDKTILIAEDNRINQTVIKAMLHDTGAKLLVANNGIQAIDMSEEFTPDLILMDIQMPKLDGISACKKIKLLHPQLPIIALTANVMAYDIQTYQEAGFDGYVGKPIELPLLKQAIENVF